MEYIRRRATVGFVIAGMAIGGNEKSVAMLSKALSDEYDICIIVFNGENISNNYSGELIDLREPARSGMFNKIIVSMRRLWKLKKIIAQRKIDVLFTFTNSLNAVSHYSFANVKKIVSCRDCGDLINRTKYYAHMAKVSDYMIFNSKFMQNYFLIKYPQYRNKCSTVYNIVDYDAINKEATENIPPEHDRFFCEHDVIIAVGRFCKEKGYNHLIRSFATLRENIESAGLLIVGDGELFTTVQQMVANYKFKNDILLVGAQKNPYKYMKRSKIFVLSSITEGFPNVLLEAMACGLPVVAADCTSGPREVLTGQCDYDNTILGFIVAKYGILCQRFAYSNDYSTIKASNAAEGAMTSALMYLFNNNKVCDEYSTKSRSRSLFYGATKASESVSDVFHNIL